MSTTTGIRANPELEAFLSVCRDGRVRMLKIAIRSEQLTLEEAKEANGEYVATVLETFKPAESEDD